MAVVSSAADRVVQEYVTQVQTHHPKWSTRASEGS